MTYMNDNWFKDWLIFTYESIADSTEAPPQCYICLGEDDDDEALVRDCSCRGDSAGFAHQSCIVQFNEQKSKEATAKDDPSSLMQ